MNLMHPSGHGVSEVVDHMDMVSVLVVDHVDMVSVRVGHRVLFHLVRSVLFRS